MIVVDVDAVSTVTASTMVSRKAADWNTHWFALHKLYHRQCNDIYGLRWTPRVSIANIKQITRKQWKLTRSDSQLPVPEYTIYANRFVYTEKSTVCLVYFDLISINNKPFCLLLTQNLLEIRSHEQGKWITVDVIGVGSLWQIFRVVPYCLTNAIFVKT